MSTEKNSPEQVDVWTRQLWDYLQLHQEIRPMDAIFVLGSHDLHVPDRVVEIYKEGLASMVLISGGVSKVSSDTWKRPEAEVFAEIMEKQGVPRSAMLLDTTALDTGENYTAMKELVRAKGLPILSVIIVAQPYMERRALATGLRMWPEVELVVTSPCHQYDDYVKCYEPNELSHVLVGQVQRLSEYTKRDWIIAEPLPEEVQQAWRNLVAAGFTDHLVASEINI